MMYVLFVMIMSIVIKLLISGCGLYRCASIIMCILSACCNCFDYEVLGLEFDEYDVVLGVYD